MTKTVHTRLRRIFNSLIALTVAATAGFALTSCLGNDDEEYDNGPQYPAEIIGSWIAQSQTIKVQEERMVDGKDTWVDVGQTIVSDPRERFDIMNNGIMVEYQREQGMDTWVETARGPWAYTTNDYLIFAPSSSEENQRLYYVPALDNISMQLVNTIITVNPDDNKRKATTTATSFTRTYSSGLTN